MMSDRFGLVFTFLPIFIEKNLLKENRYVSKTADSEIRRYLNNQH
jgi:hypothetical protein